MLRAAGFGLVLGIVLCLTLVEIPWFTGNKSNSSVLEFVRMRAPNYTLECSFDVLNCCLWVGDVARSVECLASKH